jgi:hypothetical protein
MSLRGLVAFALFLGVAACSLFTSFEELSTAATPPTDGGSTPSADASDGAGVEPVPVDGGEDVALPILPNLHPRGTFENGCDGWGGYQATVSPSDVAHSGVGSCRFCAKFSDYFSGDDSGFLDNPAVGEYRVEMWVRAAPQKQAPDQLAIFLRTIDGVPFVQHEINGSPPVSLDDTWRRLETTLTVTQPAELLNSFVSSDTGPADRCFLVDDVRVERLR